MIETAAYAMVVLCGVLWLVEHLLAWCALLSRPAV